IGRGKLRLRKLGNLLGDLVDLAPGLFHLGLVDRLLLGVGTNAHCKPRIRKRLQLIQRRASKTDDYLPRVEPFHARRRQSTAGGGKIGSYNLKYTHAAPKERA